MLPNLLHILYDVMLIAFVSMVIGGVIGLCFCWAMFGFDVDFIDKVMYGIHKRRQKEKTDGHEHDK